MNNTLLDNSITNRLKVRLEILEEFLSNKSIGIQSTGLFHGKMGLAVFYYHLSKVENCKENENKADEFIDSIYEALNSANVSPDFENGAAGIGWGIEYLTQNGFLEADTDEVLEEVDNRVYKHIVFEENLPINVGNGLLGYAFYILKRLESCHNPALSRLLEMLLIEIVNKVVVLVDKQLLKFSEPSGFNLFWELPLTLLVFGKVLEKGIYSNKIYQLLKELTPVICTLFPLLHSNRAYLLLGLHAVNKHWKLPHWKEHADILASNTSLLSILNTEFYDKNIFLRNGMSGAFLIAQTVSELNILPNTKLIPENWTKKILESSMWDILHNEEKPAPAALEFLGGFPGVLTALTQNNNLRLS
ncbi:lanthionine synthetase LanC family protein [Gaoshiqia sp. Z1-71]|uniref:lanthionine synthetase LanC family protein n=1 Tax=Gaoshiqia hydrogeniformans TaxID=3290090 RepID=UPI003BF8A37E